MRASIRALLAAFVLGSASTAAAATIHDEAVNGDLSGNRLAPTTYTLGLGASSILGSTVGGDLDYVTVNIPSGRQLASLVLASFTSTDDIGFLAFQAGSTLTEPPGAPNVTQLLGWTHFGTGALAGGANPGTDVLDNLCAGGSAIGCSPPLPSGSYTFWIQQTNPEVVGYQFDFVVVPEPSIVFLFGAGLSGLAIAGRKRT